MSTADLSVSPRHTENDDAKLGLNVPQTKIVIFRDGKEEIWVDGMNSEFIDCLAVTNEELFAGLSHGTHQTNHAASATHGNQRISCDSDDE